MSEGDVVLAGESLKELPAHRIVAKGIHEVRADRPEHAAQVLGRH
jgi:ABC-type branched-subunit amino acid transport system ATPase component